MTLRHFITTVSVILHSLQPCLTDKRLHFSRSTNTMTFCFSLYKPSTVLFRKILPKWSCFQTQGVRDPRELNIERNIFFLDSQTLSTVWLYKDGGKSLSKIHESNTTVGFPPLNSSVPSLLVLSL